uniref:Uncharacterized protein n=1 Tax=Arundo donax TaxID=35708 RepID=A0A0A9E8V4_ARUDO
MYSKGRGLTRQRTSDTALTASHSSSLQPLRKPDGRRAPKIKPHNKISLASVGCSHDG